MRGVVKKYLDQKGYGHLKVPGEHDVFFHATGFMTETDQDAIRQGDEVEFQWASGTASHSPSESGSLTRS